ncbi:MAG TPA: PP2C family protein-serine/threonine phosphatase [Solirubrobacteraceae bacterium]|nr:PP2C family protein-serine/threonine phosphatase [Solirubrobacteraceae bacterium]
MRAAPGSRRSAVARGNLQPTSPVASLGATVLATGQGAQHAVRRPVSHPSVSHTPENPLAQIGGHIPLPIPVPDWSKPIIIALLLLVAWFGTRARLAALRARRLERQRVTLLGDLDAMQAALVPDVPARLGGLAVSVAYRPAEGPAAGGDFYDLFVPEPGKVAIMLGDVAGHGHQALTQAALTRYTLRAYLQAGLEPRAALALAGRVLGDPMSERFATVAAGVYDARSGTLTYALAGHPPPILHGMPARDPLTVCSSPPIGWDRPTGHRQTTVSLPAGAAACFFSDGLIEARCDGELLGRERLSGILNELGNPPRARDLLARVRASAEGAPDDMVACVLSPDPTAVCGRIHLEELEVDARALSRADVRRFLEECAVPAAEIADAIELASAIAASSGSALLRVELSPAGSTVTATDGSAAPGASSARGQHAAREAPVEALLAD